jgi:hypothetical protein
MGSPAITYALPHGGIHPSSGDALYNLLADGVCSCSDNDDVELVRQLVQS